MAMVFKEALEDAHTVTRYSLQIFTSDLDRTAIATGRAGLFSSNIATDVPETRLNRFFVEDPGGFRVCNEIREMVVFAAQNMKNWFKSTEFAVLFLDGLLNVRRFMASTTRIIKLIPGDHGRPITDIVTNLNYSNMARDAQDGLRPLVFPERDVSTTNGCWFKIRIMPYQTLENRIDGLVITFSNITASKTLEADLRAAQATLAELLSESKLQGADHGLS